MCSIFGVATGLASFQTYGVSWRHDVEESFATLLRNSQQRGRDGFGYSRIVNDMLIMNRSVDKEIKFDNRLLPGIDHNNMESVIGNCRAEPTTEWVLSKNENDQQPYALGKWVIVHNGTIANDKELRSYKYQTTIDSAAIVETLVAFSPAQFDSLTDAYETFRTVIGKLRGSYAILATHHDYPGYVFAACNYRPLWYATRPDSSATFFASDRDMFNGNCGVPQMLEPYSQALFHSGGIVAHNKRSAPERAKALVVCSGGLDSVTAAAWAKDAGYDVTLVHFMYGCRAQQHEVNAVKAVADELGVPIKFLPMLVYGEEASPLLRKDCDIAGGEQGAEFAFEWVPARNLVMLALATAYAEQFGFDYIVLGNNLEEAGAYPDNEPEFYRRFNDLLPFAVGDGKRVEVLQPVGNLMKHEIVKLGHKVGAPLHLTWSCYKHGKKHCGKCGPCYMRKTAFEINGLDEVLEYEV